jgi:hypothetical protein
VDVWFSTSGLVQASHNVGCKHSDRYLLGNNSFAIASTKFLIKRCAKLIIIIRGSCGKATVCVRGCAGDNSERKHRQVVLLGEANLGRCRIQCGFEGAVERGEWYFEVDDIVRRGLDADGLKYRILYSALDS